MTQKWHGSWLASWHENGVRKRKAFRTKKQAEAFQQTKRQTKKEKRPKTKPSRKSSGATQRAARTAA